MKKRKCPWGHGELLKTKIIGIEIDHCPECGGIFFDKDEFERITKIDLITQKEEKEYKIPCPNCDSDMTEFVHKLFPLNSSAFHCEKCKGIFIPGKTIKLALPEMEKLSPEYGGVKSLIAITFLDEIHKGFEAYSPAELNCPFDGNTLKNYEIKNDFGKNLDVKRCEYCGGLFFSKGGAYSVDKENVLNIDEKEVVNFQIHHNIPKCPVCKKDMRKFINPVLKIEGIFICPVCYGMWFEKGKISEFKEFIEKRKKRILSPEDELAITFIKKLGAEKAGPYLDVIYRDLKRKANAETESNFFPKIAFLSFLFPILSPPFRIIFLFAEDILYTIKEFLNKLKNNI
ncbi:MAG: zf-TFIIB domain-containing protein [candidate division WOR-3 bacterium]